MGREKQLEHRFLQSLLHDRTANTIAISAAALIPLVAMVGGGIDASRYYMAASRMQAACDAGALAARRAMTDDTFTSEHRTLGLNFFDQNFEEGMFGTLDGERDYTSDGEGVVTGTASGTLPTTLMGAFGYQTFGIDVSCTAEINISNSDIMFVLDVTGSMNCAPANVNGGSCNNTPEPGSKIEALRASVVNFYDTVEAATSQSAQVRYGFVPYSHNVNVGASIPRQYMADAHTYQSRVARFEEKFTFIPGNGVEVGDEIVISDQVEWMPKSTTKFGSGSTNDYRFRNRTSPVREDPTDYNLCNAMSGITHTVNGQQWEILTDEYVLNVWSGGSSNNRAGCRGRIRKTRIATQDDVIEDETVRTVVFKDYVYCPVDTTDPTPCDVENPVGSPAGWETVNLGTLYTNNTIQLPTGTNGAMVNHTWGGCVEEATSVVTGNYDPIPANAHDLNINLVPNSQATRWKPMLQNAVWKREDNSGNNVMGWLYQTANENRPSYTCPRASRKMTEISRTDLQSYLNALTASGNTYHDIGMVWAARFISPRGIFAAENSSAPNGDAIARHIVFMTDGMLATNNENYTPHGIEWWDRRVTSDGSNTQDNTRRALRLQAVCRAARQENITVWVVAFGTTLTQNLIDCASPGRAFQADDSDELDARFQEIAQKIAALRLTS